MKRLAGMMVCVIGTLVQAAPMVVNTGVDGSMDVRHGTSFTDATMMTDFIAWWDYSSDYVRFDLSGVTPAQWNSGMAGREAHLKLYVTSLEQLATPVDVYISRVSENNTNTDTSKMNISYNNTDTSTLWTSDGWQDNFQMNCGTGTLDRKAATAVGQWMDFNVTDAVDQWVLNGKLNNGFVIEMGGTKYGLPGGTNYSVAFATFENPDASLRPVLEMVPEPVTLVLLGLGGVVLRRRV